MFWNRVIQNLQNNPSCLMARLCNFFIFLSNDRCIFISSLPMKKIRRFILGKVRLWLIDYTTMLKRCRNQLICPDNVIQLSFLYFFLAQCCANTFKDVRHLTFSIGIHSFWSSSNSLLWSIFLLFYCVYCTPQRVRVLHLRLNGNTFWSTGLE